MAEVVAQEEAAREPTISGSPTRRRLRAFRANRAAVLGLLFVLALTLAAVLAPLLAPYPPQRLMDAESREGPSWRHPFGTDGVGRDVLSNVIYGTRVSLPIGLVSVGIALGAGVLVGGIAAFEGGLVEVALMFVIDVLLAFPSILLALLIVTMLGRGTFKVMIAVGVADVPRFARQMRAEVLSLKEREFVLASRALGARGWTILFGRILPNALGPMIVLATVGIATAVLEAAGLGFLGLGAEASSPEWGTMLADNRDFLTTSWWLAVFPGIAIASTVLAFNLVGDGIRDAYDPRTGLGIKGK